MKTMDYFRRAALVGSVCVAVGYHRPVVGLAVDAGNHIGGKLEDFEFFVGPFQCLCWGGP